MRRLLHGVGERLPVLWLPYWRHLQSMPGCRSLPAGREWMKTIVSLAVAGILIAACNQDGPGKPDTYTPSPKPPDHQWVDPTPRPTVAKGSRLVGTLCKEEEHGMWGWSVLDEPIRCTQTPSDQAWRWRRQ